MLAELYFLHSIMDYEFHRYRFGTVVSFFDCNSVIGNCNDHRISDLVYVMDNESTIHKLLEDVQSGLEPKVCFELIIISL